MQLVDRPYFNPGVCAINLQGDPEQGPYIDTGNTPPFVDPRIYLSRQGVIDAGRAFGFPTPDEYAEVLSERARLARENEELRDRIAEADRYAEAAEYTLKATFGDDTKIRNKPGRKPKVSV